MKYLQWLRGNSGDINMGTFLQVISVCERAVLSHTEETG
uniref:Uncharacterized protein n=1 Tax=Anguilla anguilla TaxID=7936 RepID=A0A0E9RPB8_ANGAN